MEKRAGKGKTFSLLKRMVKFRSGNEGKSDDCMDSLSVAIIFLECSFVFLLSGFCVNCMFIF